MLSENEKGNGCVSNYWVLILIVLEDALWAGNSWSISEYVAVLILIVLEDALWDKLLNELKATESVLILIVLEDALWEDYR